MAAPEQTHKLNHFAFHAARPEELAFLRTAVENPGDTAPLRILADWLEEHDDPRRAELLRLHLNLRATCCEPRRRGRAAQQKRLVELLAQGVRPAVPRQTMALPGGVAMTFAWIPPGTFLMGSPPREKRRHDDETQHRVTLTKGFWMGVTPVTQTQWEVVMDSNFSYFQGNDRPVECVSWEDCQKFCKKLGYLRGQRFRLPTEAEWEYACRAGTATPFFFGTTLSTEQANYNGNYPYGQGNEGVCRGQTTPVGSSPPNAWGLFDMHGNLWEWCADGYGPYPQGDLIDPQSSNKGDARVVRGGCWNGNAGYCRAACRRGSAPGLRNHGIGLRVCFRLD